ncbi:hypothetical protein SAMN04487996_12248 [Dyadobacter soli]|uniref:Uncharacterized protein n=1 Tax=Dyadobacter soli TaxID=659014 RepID=A0A1G7WH89_9BACT|nr:hypothetical protein [Dyadobacter soli]SDG71387.1 hypothetical protein SAMN04487996_12248 [Dyadobacter soli]
MNPIQISHNRVSSNIGLLITICASTIIPTGNYVPSGDYKSIRAPYETVYPHLNVAFKKNTGDEEVNAGDLLSNCATNLLVNSVDLDGDIVDMVNENFWNLV